MKRVFRCQVELGPYMGGESKRFAYWHAVPPAGRFMVAVQQVRDRENLANEKRNPVLYRAILNPPPYTCDMDLDKFVLIFGGHHMFHVIEAELQRSSWLSISQRKTCSNCARF